jgi:hypothetical protein
MKIVLVLFGVAAMASAAVAAPSHSVRGYTRANGTYVAPHMQTNPNATRVDNYSAQGNVNPYTGKAGTIDTYAPKLPKPPRQ